MKKCCFILPFFGKLPIYFQLFLDTFSFNKSFNLLVFTDDTKSFRIPNNVKIIVEPFSDLVNLFKSKLGNKICLSTPYKLCDYKPSYGLVFSKYLFDYKYWGYCDCDILFGSLSKLEFIISKQPDKIFASGHMTLYKNSKEINSLFLKQINGSCLFSNVSRSNQIFGFDEDFFQENIHSIFLDMNKSTINDDFSFNCDTRFYNFKRRFYSSDIRQWKDEPYFCTIFWHDGHLYSFDSKKNQREFLYLHLQGRKQRLHDCKNYKYIVVTPQSIVCRNDYSPRFKMIGNFNSLKFLLKRIKYWHSNKTAKNPKEYKNLVEYKNSVK
jgi:hypothetical protein